MPLLVLIQLTRMSARGNKKASTGYHIAVIRDSVQETSPAFLHICLYLPPPDLHSKFNGYAF